MFKELNWGQNHEIIISYWLEWQRYQVFLTAVGYKNDFGIEPMVDDNNKGAKEAGVTLWSDITGVADRMIRFTKGV